MPRVLPSVAASSVGVGVHRLLLGRVAQPLAQVDLVQALRRDALEVELRRTPPARPPTPRRGTPRSSRSDEAPANVLRRHQVGQVRRRLGVHVLFSGWAITGSPSASCRPSTWWQREHWAMNVCSPVGGERVAPPARCTAPAGWPSTSRSRRRRGRRPPSACWRARGRRTRCTGRRRCRAGRPRCAASGPGPGTMSRLPLSLGIQKLWITSRLVPRTSTLVPVGIDHLAARHDRRVSMPPQPSCDRVVDLPPPLLAGDVDVALGVVGLRQRHQRADGRDRHADEDQRRQDRQADLERRAAVRLLGDRLAAVR